MAIELECGSCGRRLHVEAGEEVAVCPHCRTTLHVPPSDESNAGNRDAGEKTPGVSKTPGVFVSPKSGPVPFTAAESVTDVEPESPSQFAFLELADHLPAAPPDSKVFPGFPIGVDDVDDLPEKRSAKFISHAADSVRNAPVQLQKGRTTEIGASAAKAAEPSLPVEPPPADAKPSGPTAADEQKALPAVTQSRGVPRFLFVMLAGYASAVTIALIWLWWTRGRVHPLESLPDVEPKSTSYIIPESSPLPKGHSLALGETRRFGDLEITPLRVIRGPALLVAVSAGAGDADPEGESTFPLLKLWLRIRNVSDDQTFRPFGRELLRLPGPSRRFNTFVCRADQQREDGERVLVYHLWQSQHDLALQGQHVDRKLGPQETCETYVASSDQGIDDLKGDLVWRVHFRKGRNRKTGRGVTTLIDVALHSDAIQDESPRENDE